MFFPIPIDECEAQITQIPQQKWDTLHENLAPTQAGP